MTNRVNPYKLFVGAFLPNWLIERPEISEGAKIVYARLMQHAGKAGYAYPSQKTLAEELGLSVRHVQRHLKALIEVGLIEEQRVGLGQVNRYYFLDHPWFSRIRHDIDVVSDTTEMSPTEATEMSHVRESVELESVQENQRTTTFAPNGKSHSVPLKVAFTPEGFVIPQETLARWKETYPALDVSLEVKAAFEWISANPERRKSNWDRFLVNWLKRSQDRARPSRSSDPATRAAQIKSWLGDSRDRNRNQPSPDTSRSGVRTGLPSGSG